MDEPLDLGKLTDAVKDTKNFRVGKGLEGDKRLEGAQIIDLYDDDAIMEEIEREGNLVIEEDPVKGASKGKPQRKE